MAISVGNDIVIDNSLRLQNIAGANGEYDSLTPNVTPISNVINFDTPMMSCTLSSATTFSETGVGNGKAAMLLLDTSSSSHTPTFSANIRFSTGSTPSWADYRYWQIVFQCVGTSIRTTATGFGPTGAASPPPPSPPDTQVDTISLAGTSASPESTGVLWPAPTYIGPGTSGRDRYSLANHLRFTSTGNIERLDLENGVTTFSTTQWCNQTPSKTYYIRVSEHDGGEAYQVPITFNDEFLDTWLALTSTRTFGRSESYEVLGQPLYGTRSVVMKVEISDQADGSNILATGYYRILWEGGA